MHSYKLKNARRGFLAALLVAMAWLIAGDSVDGQTIQPPEIKKGKTVSFYYPSAWTRVEVNNKTVIRVYRGKLPSSIDVTGLNLGTATARFYGRRPVMPMTVPPTYEEYEMKSPPFGPRTFKVVP